MINPATLLPLHRTVVGIVRLLAAATCRRVITKATVSPLRTTRPKCASDRCSPICGKNLPPGPLSTLLRRTPPVALPGPPPYLPTHQSQQVLRATIVSLPMRRWSIRDWSAISFSLNSVSTITVQVVAADGEVWYHGTFREKSTFEESLLHR